MNIKMKNRQEIINSANRDFWDIIKGIGILSVVLGHTCDFAYGYVYTYHLALFFFVGGYLYSEEKYGDKPWDNLASRLKSTWPKYVFFESFFIIFHNLFLDVGIIINEERFTLRDYAVNFGNMLDFCDVGGKMGGALWFVPVLVAAVSMLGMVVWIGRKIGQMFSKSSVKYGTIIMLGITLGFFGVAITIKRGALSHHFDTAFLVMPILITAYLTRVFCKNLSFVLKGYVAIPLAVAVFYAVDKMGWFVNLAQRQIIGPWQFYLISFEGIYICLYLGKIFLRISVLRQYFSLIGRYSFEIMACHFLTTKIIDLVYAKIIGEEDRNVYGVFACAYSSQCWLAYAIVGTLFVAFLFRLADKVKAKSYQLSYGRMRK